MTGPNDATSNRILVFFSCWCLLALPIHYFICAVERNTIPPLDSVLNKNIIFPIKINIHCISTSDTFCVNTNHNISLEVQLEFNNSDKFKFTINDYTYNSINDINILSNCSLLYNNILYLNCLKLINKDIENDMNTYNVFLIDIDNTNIDNEFIISQYRSVWINTNQKHKDDVSILNKEIISVINMIILSDINNINNNIGIRNQIFSFTLLNSEPEIGYNFKWDMNEIYNDYLLPFFNRINNTLIYDYYIDSQILYYGYIISEPPTDNIHNVNVKPHNLIIKQNTNYYFVTNNELQTFIGGTDWNRISTLINDIIPIQFVIYIPPKQYLPLLIKDKSNTTYDSFMVPRFGGCIIYNPNNINNMNNTNQSIKINTAHLYSTFNLIISQLRLLFGLKNNYHNNYHFIMDKSGINEWELDMLIRNNIVKDLETVEVSLKNIYDMINKVSQLPINTDVAALITDAVYAFDRALQACNNYDYKKCIQWTKYSHYLAKKAEYHPSMLPTLYFSPEFTYAVYSPYFLPGYIPIVAAIFNKLKTKYKQYIQKTNS